MIYVDKETNKISLVRGDTATLSVKVKNGDGTDRPLLAGEHLYFVAVDNLTEPFKTLQLEADENGVFTFDSEDTYYMAFGLYMYNVKLYAIDGSVFTVIPMSPFELLEEVRVYE